MLTCNPRGIPLLTLFILLTPNLANAAQNLNIQVLPRHSQEYLRIPGEHQRFAEGLSGNHLGDRVIETEYFAAISMENADIHGVMLGGHISPSRPQRTAVGGLTLAYPKGCELPKPIHESPNEYRINEQGLEKRALSQPNGVGSAVTLPHSPAKPYQGYYHYILTLLYILLALLLICVISFLSVLTRKNRLIEQRSIDLKQQIDLTERTKERLNEAQRLAKQGSWEWDLNTSKIYRSDGLVHLYKGCTDIDGNCLDKFRCPLGDEAHAAFEATVDHLRNTGGSSEYIHRLKTKDGQLRVTQETIRLVNHADGRPGRLIGTVQDITEQHQAQTRLRESEEKYRLLFEMSEDPMLLIVEQEIVTANRAAARALGFETEQRLIGMHLAELAPEKQPDGQASIAKASAIMKTALEQGYHRLEWKFRNQDGSHMQVEASLTRIPYVGKNAIYCIWRDIMEIKRIQDALKQKSAYLNGILSSSERVSIIATNPEGTIQYYNQTAEKLFGMPAERAVGVNLAEIHRVQGVDNSRNRLGLERAKDEGEYRFTMDMRQTDGLHHIDARVSPIYSDSREFAGYMLMCEDVTDQRRASELIAYQASYDALTDLPNRRMFLDNLQQAIARTRRHHHKGAVLFLDLDNFKNINDSLGHPVGDNLLQQVAQRMWGTIREEDTVARLGGDEFVILMPELSKDSDEAINEVQMLANKIRVTMALPYRVDDHELHITTSIGIAIFPATEESPDDILRQADTAMYRAKESGRNAVRFFLPSMQLAAQERHKILSELRQAIPKNELHVFYQPQFNVERQLCSVEALLRWQHPKRGLVMPSGFIPQAEESSLILDIGDWVLHEALIQYKAWRTRYPHVLRGRIAINVSALQFKQHDFIHKIKRALNKTEADPDWLTLEMTESMLLKDFDETVEKINDLKQLGVRFSIDDFGTGYSSLAYLKRLPVDEIKIDRSFVHDVIEDPNDAALVETIITLAQQTDLQTVAEGVETHAVFDFLRQHGCNLFQGFYLARPCDKNSFKDFYLNP